MSHIGSSTFYMFCFLHCLLKVWCSDSYSLFHYANRKTYCCCLFLQLHPLLYRQNVYIAPFSIMLSSSICYSNSFLAFKHRSVLFWLCSNMTGPLWIETHDKGDLQLFFPPHHDGSTAGEQQWVWKYHQGRRACTHAASVMKYTSYFAVDRLQHWGKSPY